MPDTDQDAGYSEAAVNKLVFLFWLCAFPAWEGFLAYRSTKVALGAAGFLAGSVLALVAIPFLVLIFGLASRTLRASLAGMGAGLLLSIPLVAIVLALT